MTIETIIANLIEKKLAKIKFIDEQIANKRAARYI